MRTLVLSDIHLGNGQGYDIFAGGEALPALLDRERARGPLRVFLNGDTVDFLMNEDPLELSVGRAVAQARAIAEAPASAGVLRALGQVLSQGGEVVVRLGNHDVELFLPEVQAVFSEALGAQGRLRFEGGEAPALLELNGARILLTHGEHADPWNRVDYDGLRAGEGYAYAPGSRLVKLLLNPLKRRHRMRFADLVKPDFQGGVLTALAVEPGAMRVAFQRSTLSLAHQLLGRLDEAVSFGPGGEAPLGLAVRLGEAGLDPDELAALEALLFGEGLSFSAPGEPPEGDPASAKVLRAALRLYARAQRRAVGAAGERFWSLEPEESEWADAVRLADKFGVGAVLAGHTHAARWRAEAGRAFVNTGTWIWLMGTPPADAPLERWVHFLTTLRRDPALEAEGRALLRACFTAARLDPAPGGARLQLFEWTDQGEERILGETTVAPA